jgi:hypothetical protein
VIEGGAEGEALPGEVADDVGEDAAPESNCGTACEPGTRHQPEPDPPREIGEAEACATLTDAYVEHALEMGCPVTIRPCPEYLRLEQGQACLMYDGDSIDECIALWRSTASCSQLAQNACEPEAIEGSAPRGCS